MKASKICLPPSEIEITEMPRFGASIVENERRSHMAEFTKIAWSDHTFQSMDRLFAGVAWM